MGLTEDAGEVCCRPFLFCHLSNRGTDMPRSCLNLEPQGRWTVQLDLHRWRATIYICTERSKDKE